MAIQVNGWLLLLGGLLMLVIRPALRRWEANAAQPAPVVVDVL